MTRLEKDSTGKIRVPKKAYFGAFTTRALQNFQISELLAPVLFAQALGLIKHAAAKTNGDLKEIPKKYAKAIQKAADEFVDGKFEDEFVLDVFQAGAGTPYNMNANEILANRANEILGGKIGAYDPIHPNNHVNLGQSSNDVIPTATRIAVLFALDILLEEMEEFEKSLNEKAKEFSKIKKVGRTHLQDAVPMTLGQEFKAFAEYVAVGKRRISATKDELRTLGIGGTALGTGINSHPKFATKIVQELSSLCDIKFKQAKNKFATTSSHTIFLQTAGALKSLALDLNKIANDLKLLGSGPRTGFGEITLPEVQPGSSIMPGKVNPSIPECITMICAQVVGNEHTVEFSCNEGHLQLNTMCPIIMYNILWSIQILTNGLTMFREKCIDGINTNEDRIKELFDGSLCKATSLVKEHGYDKVAEMVKKGEL
jgi:fumarate hydratase class II